MSYAIPHAKRLQIIEYRQSGKSFTWISQQLGIPYSSVRNIWKRFEQNGLTGLQTNYSNCGPKGVKTSALIYRSALWLKRLHPKWGAPYIRTLLAQRYPNENLASVRTMQVWFRKQAYKQPPVRRTKVLPTQVKQTHDCWQVDAKEQIKLADDSSACYLTMVDVKSGAILDAPAFPPSQD